MLPIPTPRGIITFNEELYGKKSRGMTKIFGDAHMRLRVQCPGFKFIDVKFDINRAGYTPFPVMELIERLEAFGYRVLPTCKKYIITSKNEQYHLFYFKPEEAEDDFFVDVEIYLQ